MKQKKEASNLDSAPEMLTKRVSIKKEVINKILGVSSLFRDELPLDAKEGEVLGFFLEKGFMSLVESGEIKKRLNNLVGDLADL
ncbi:hypothetical protein FY034_18955 (plasmid) [Trichlorobacter lovleyi]|uniref:hypothetical protein n=1 Tax=Trichlorobacter lovleyi TaxID=313985 RepID=UPI00223F985C|nr:hypothetical protein [Trichlorobacter lovleyi]QOX81057.1 hypothetical protein FY034_18955 [Trichlorobacter lovleyi]